MYIHNEFLELQVSIVFYLIMIPLWALAFNKIRKIFKLDSIPIIILGTAFSFTILMFDLPFLIEIPGNITCATLLSILFGPWTSLIIITSALMIKSIFFGDGGISTFAVNSFILAFITSFTGYYLYNKVNSSKTLRTIFPKPLIAGISAYFSSIFSVISLILIFKLQILLVGVNTSSDFPYTIRSMIAIMLAEHLLILGLIEAAITITALVFLTRDNNYLLNLITKNNKLLVN
ncbi:MAG: hypothetical protein A2287_07635 [Candidatus Melainabacteria bacterium RIFOXYA12_FULL_32_12]|nr:MAG: hypothetical protein A2255_07665 [Candidatus Melainabacteria bacterium RIFOXYA2_FULL_32_9]OGI30697.1 MAG: hypothetical protein A2287_07635 [Candidatus Melainabacteria bacterium RIFOXYA12_FULL_32_12]